MFKERLLKLAELLDSVKDEEFNINRWRSSCGTVACAIGHAAGDKYFQDLGLSFIPPCSYPTGQYSEGYVPYYDGFSGIEASARLFGITIEDAEYLFLGRSYDLFLTGKVKPSDVAQRLRNYVLD